MRPFRVIDCRSMVVIPEQRIEANAGRGRGSSLEHKMMRGGPSRDLVARVHWTEGGSTNMVRLYTPQAAN